MDAASEGSGGFRLEDICLTAIMHSTFCILALERVCSETHYGMHLCYEVEVSHAYTLNPKLSTLSILSRASRARIRHLNAKPRNPKPLDPKPGALRTQEQTLTGLRAPTHDVSSKWPEMSLAFL